MSQPTTDPTGFVSQLCPNCGLCCNGVLFGDVEWCQVYADRPIRCRTFECRLLKQVTAGEVAVTVALRKTTEARRITEQVRKLVRELGHTDESMPLNRRYATIAAQPIDLATDEERVERRSELMLAVGRLVKVLERDFLGRD
jgi:hypothetical protein